MNREDLSWIAPAITAIKASRIAHRNYVLAVSDVFEAINAAQPGELVILVGPSRAGKSRVLKESTKLLRPKENTLDSEQFQMDVYVDAENASKGGEFSTKYFMRKCLEAIRHPIYGAPHADDEWGIKLDRLIHQTPEQTLRAAFEHACEKRRVYLIAFDEAHHVEYIAGGELAATRVLDSYKCLAAETKTVLLLVGSYRLLTLLALAPHLLGRQRPIEFPRYRADSEDDVEAFAGVLDAYSKYCVFKDAKISLRSWLRELFEHSLGCVGHLSMWLRATLAHMVSRKIPTLSLEILMAKRLPALQEAEIAAEIVAGEAALAHLNEDTDKPSQSSGQAREKSAKNHKPFRRRARRSPIGGRS